MIKYSSAQIKLLYELLEEHPYGPNEYWYFPWGRQRTGDKLVEAGVVEKEPGYDYKVGYRLTQAGRDLLKSWDER